MLNICPPPWSSGVTEGVWTTVDLQGSLMSLCFFSCRSGTMSYRAWRLECDAAVSLRFQPKHERGEKPGRPRGSAPSQEADFQTRWGGAPPLWTSVPRASRSVAAKSFRWQPSLPLELRRNWRIPSTVSSSPFPTRIFIGSRSGRPPEHRTAPSWNSPTDLLANKYLCAGV